jgi:putative membrane protein
MSEGSDPRVFFAAERTLLAWLPTGLTVAGLGFLVSRLSLFHLATGHAPGGSTGLGVGLVALGALMMGGATVQHARFCRGLTAFERAPGYWSGFAVWVSGALTVISLGLAVYLVFA